MVRTVMKMMQIVDDNGGDGDYDEDVEPYHIGWRKDSLLRCNWLIYD